MLSNQFFPKYGPDYSLQNVALLYISITSEIGFRLITSPHRHFNWEASLFRHLASMSAHWAFFYRQKSITIDIFECFSYITSLPT